MSNITNVVVIGLGAIGAIYAAKLQEYDPACVRILVDAQRRDRYQSSGIVLNGHPTISTMCCPMQMLSQPISF